jgi:three-Cys-motif partner protein
MSRPKTLKLDEIGPWSEVKLDIVRKYAKAYSTILSSQKAPRLSHVYIDAFAGAGVHISKRKGQEIAGSPLNAVNTDPPFREYHLIDLDGSKVQHLRGLLAGRPDVHIYEGDCNCVLLDQVLPNVRYEQFRRGLCLLDPYGMHLNWEVIRAAGQLGTIDLFLNFPVMDMNRNVLRHRPEGAKPEDVARMTAFWGDDSWRQVAYKTVRLLFGDEEEKTNNEIVAEAFRERLKKVAGFVNVPAPLPMRNSRGAVVYYLFFASKKPVAQHIVTDIFKTYKDRGACV